MPGVAIDQNQQIHIRNTEGPQFQYQINGVMVPIDINTNPPFISMINPMFIKQLSLLDGILPSRYSFATGGVVNIQTKDGCEQPDGSVSMYGGQRNTCSRASSTADARATSATTSAGYIARATPRSVPRRRRPDAIHDHTDQGQGFGFFAYDLNPTTRLSLITSFAASKNQLPNQPNLLPQFSLAGVGAYPSADINSYLNFRDYLGILALNGAPAPGLTYQLAYSAHYISQKLRAGQRWRAPLSRGGVDRVSQRPRQHAAGRPHLQLGQPHARRRLLSRRVWSRGGRQLTGLQSQSCGRSR